MNPTACKATILVADDNDLNRELLSDILTGEGYKVICAEDGDKALLAIKNRAVDLALLDVVMPGKSGFEVCQSIKFNPETRFIPVVLVTGLSSVDERIRGIRAGRGRFSEQAGEQPGTAGPNPFVLRLKEYTDELENAETVLFSLALSIEAKDPYTKGHCDRFPRIPKRWGAGSASAGGMRCAAQSGSRA